MNNNANINTYFGAKWNIEICKSGDGLVESYYPLGKEMKNNMILDHWLEGLTYLFSPSGGLLRPTINNGLSFAAVTKGTMHIGSGSVAPNFSQTGLQFPAKSTSYIRPYFNQCTGIYYPESGMALFSRKYDFGIESKMVTYSEAGFRPDIANGLPTGKRNWLWSRFLFITETGISGYIYAISGTQIEPVNLSGVFIDNVQNDIADFNAPNYSGFSGLSSFDLGWRYNWPENSGMFLINQSGNTTGFVYTPKNITELVTGFISGYLSGGNFYPFNTSSYPNNLSGFSGVYIQDLSTQTLYFPSGGIFNEFNSITGKYFNVESGFIYTGFQSGFSIYGSGFYPTNGPLTGSMTGIIGSRNILKLDGYITGLVGYKNILYPITLNTGEYLKLRYDTYMQVPAIFNSINVTGENIVHGEFNGSGELKLIGSMKEFFGEIDGNGKVSERNGIWWPIHGINYARLSRTQRNETLYPNSHLSALMVASGKFNGIAYNDTFPLLDSGTPLITSWLDDEIILCDQWRPKIGECGVPPNQIPYFDKLWYSRSALYNQASWPLYSQGSLIVHNYVALNRPTAIWPKELNVQLIFRGQYPNQDTGINGFILCRAREGTVCGNWPNQTITDEQGNTFSTFQYIKPTINENWEAYQDCGITKEYSAWYYKFNNPQIKYEDQIINLYLTFSLNRI